MKNINLRYPPPKSSSSGGGLGRFAPNVFYFIPLLCFGGFAEGAALLP